MTRALVTGATGLVGSHIVERLIEEGWSVRALVRNPAATSDLSARGVDVATGDVLDPGSFSAAAQGCDVIFHTAAAITVRGGWSEYERLNIGGSRIAVETARSAGARLVHLSSVAVYGSTARYSPGGKTAEDAALAPLPEGAHYARSKRESEEVVLGAHRRGSIWATAVRPDVIYGPRDRQFVPRTARMLSMGIAPLIGTGRNTLAVVHAANVADGAYRAAIADAAGGQAYNLANDHDVTSEEFFTLAARGLGRRVVMLRIPLAVARGGILVARVFDSLLLGGRYHTAVAGSLNFMSRDNPFTSERARWELGWEPRVRPEQGVPEAFAWWLGRGRGSGLSL